MSDTFSLFVVSGVLAIGGLGLLMLKNDDQDETKQEEPETEDNTLASLFHWNMDGGETKEEVAMDIENITEENDMNVYNFGNNDGYGLVKPARRRPRTQTNRRVSSASRRRYN